MTGTETDRIAFEAARLFASGQVDSLPVAIRQAVEALGLHQTPPPSPGRVRQHLQARSMQALGDVGYQKAVDDFLNIAQKIMALLEASFDDLETFLVGRAAKGFCDGGTTLHIRMYTKQSVGLIAARLVEGGYEEPEFRTAETRFGRLDRMRLSEAGVEIVLTRCRPALQKHAGEDLFTGRRIDALDLDSLNRRLGG